MYGYGYFNGAVDGYGTGYGDGYSDGSQHQAVLDTALFSAATDPYFGGVQYGGGCGTGMARMYGYGMPSTLGTTSTTQYKTLNNKPAEVTSTGSYGEPLATKCDGGCGYYKAVDEKGWYRDKDADKDVCWRRDCRKNLSHLYPELLEPETPQIEGPKTQDPKDAQIAQLQQQLKMANTRLQQQNQANRGSPKIVGMGSIKNNTPTQGGQTVQTGRSVRMPVL